MGIAPDGPDAFVGGPKDERSGRIKMKLSKLTGVIAYSGGQMTLREGQTIDDSHPLVAERPELFDDVEATDVKSQTTNPTVVQTTMADGPGGGRIQRPARVQKVPGQ